MKGDGRCRVSRDTRGRLRLIGTDRNLADGLSSFVKLYSGLYSDRLRRRKPLAVVAYLVTALGMASFAVAGQWWHVSWDASANYRCGAKSRPQGLAGRGDDPRIVWPGFGFGP